MAEKSDFKPEFQKVLATIKEGDNREVRLSVVKWPKSDGFSFDVRHFWKKDGEKEYQLGKGVSLKPEQFAALVEYIQAHPKTVQKYIKGKGKAQLLFLKKNKK